MKYKEVIHEIEAITEKINSNAKYRSTFSETIEKQGRVYLKNKNMFVGGWCMQSCAQAKRNFAVNRHPSNLYTAVIHKHKQQRITVYNFARQ